MVAIAPEIELIGCRPGKPHCRKNDVAVGRDLCVCVKTPVAVAVVVLRFARWGGRAGKTRARRKKISVMHRVFGFKTSV